MKTNRKNQLTYKIIGLSSVFVIAVSSLAFSTYAWFATNRVATVSFMNMKVDQGLGTPTLKYYSRNYDAETASFIGYDSPASLPEGSDKVSHVTAYSDNFLTVSEAPAGTNPTIMPDLFPNICHTYAVEIENLSSSNKAIHLYLTSFSSPESTGTDSETARYIKKDGIETDHGISLASAIDIYGYGFIYSSDTANTSAAESFVTMGSALSLSDKFTYFDYSSNADSYSFDLASITVPPNGKAIFFFTILFSNDSSTYYLYDSYSATKDRYYYIRDPSGNSSPYQRLGFAINTLTIGN